MANPTTRPAMLRAALLLPLSLALTSASPLQDRADRAVPAVMRHHFDAAGAMHGAIVRGDLAGVRAAASRLATISRPSGMPASSEAFTSTIRRAANRASDTRTLGDASTDMVRILDECAACHRAQSVRITWHDAGDISGEGLARHMRTYGAGLGALLEGLVTPSDSRWQQGAAQLAGAAIGRNDWPDNPLLRDRATAAAAKIRGLAEDARRARSPADRSRVYAASIETCGECHQHYPDLWGPRRP